VNIKKYLSVQIMQCSNQAVMKKSTELMLGPVGLAWYSLTFILTEQEN
jgi:hypothetical protein